MNAPAQLRIDTDSVQFTMTARPDDLAVTLSAPTHGWLAIGVNTTTQLAGTRFIIAAPHPSGHRAEEHLAMPPRHVPVAVLGGTPTFTVSSLDINLGQPGARGTLRCSLQRRTPAPNPLDLTPGTAAGLMLAWSHSPNFDHHSAWREHFSVLIP